MFLVRLYLSVLTLLFLLCSMLLGGLDLLAGTVIVCALLYLIIDMRAELRDLSILEARVSSFLTKLADS